MQRITFSILAFPIVLLAWFIIKRRLRHSRNAQKAAAFGCLSPPILGKAGLPFIGNSILRESMKATAEYRGPQYVVEKLNAVSPTCHTAKVLIVDYEIIVTRDPDNARVLLGHADFDISATRALSWMPVLGKGIFTSRGSEWKHSRALLRPQFAKDVVNDVGLEEDHFQALLSQLPADAGTGWTEKVDLSPFFFKFSLDVITEFVWGRSTNSLRGEGVEIHEHFNASKEWIDRRGAFAKFYWLIDSKEFKETCKALHRFADGIIEDRLANPPEKASARFNLLDELAKTTKDPMVLRNETLHLITAGRDPTGCLLGWMFYFLARHPDVYAKLRAAIMDRFGDKPGDVRSLDHVHYLQWVINEVLRLVPTVPMNERTTLRDTTLPRGGGPDGMSKVFVPEGTQILIPVYAIHHRQDLWGDDVEEFRPERWETCHPGHEYLPFGAGARKCLGQGFGKTEVSYVVSRFCQKYDAIENVEQGDGLIKLRHAIECRSGTGVQVRLHEVKSARRCGLL